MGRMIQNPNDPKYLRSLLRRARKAVVSDVEYPDGGVFCVCVEYQCPLSDSLIKEIDKVLDVD